MKKTISIGLAGFPFTIEEDAFEILNRYITSIRATLDPTEADEVMHDIESRMVELFQASMNGRQILNVHDVQTVITRLGTPEQIEAQEKFFGEDLDHNATGTKTADGKNHEKKLYSNPLNKKIAGVASGMADYFNVDVSMMRLGWVVAFVIGLYLAPLFLFIGMAYCVLWAILPKATSAADFLRMRGEAPTLENLREESQKLTQETGTASSFNRQSTSNSESDFFKVVRYFFGSVFALIAISSLATGIGFLFGGLGTNTFWINGNTTDAGNILQYYLGNQSPWMLYTVIVLSTLVPALLFGMLAIKLISPKTKVKNLGFLTLAVFGASVIFSTIFGLRTYQYYEPYKGSTENTREISLQPQDSLILVDLDKKPIPAGFKSVGDVYTDGKIVFAEEKPDVEVITDSTAIQPFLRITTRAKGKMAMKEVADIRTEGNRLYLPDAILYPYKDRLRQYEVDYQLVLPKGISAKSMNPSIDLDQNKDNMQLSITSNDSGAHVNISSGNHKSISISSTTENGRTEANINVDGKKYKIVQDPSYNGKVQINGIMMTKDQAKDLLKDTDYFKDEE